MSGDVGLRKPDAAIYRLVAERLDAPPEVCVFVDDIEVNVEGARAVGMTALHHRDVDATLLELGRLFAADLTTS